MEKKENQSIITNKAYYHKNIDNEASDVLSEKEETNIGSNIKLERKLDSFKLSKNNYDDSNYNANCINNLNITGENSTISNTQLSSVSFLDGKNNKNVISSEAKNKLKILFLHGNLQSSKIFEDRCSDIIKDIKAYGDNLFGTKIINKKNIIEKFKLECLFPNAYNVLSTDSETGEEKRSWFLWDVKNLSMKENLDKETHYYKSFNESLDILEKLTSEHNDIDCIFGFSQGAFFTNILCMLKNYYEKANTSLDNNNYNNTIIKVNNMFQKLKCVVVIGGFVKPYPENEELKNIIDYFIYNNKQKLNRISIPSLHVYGEEDEHIIPKKSEEASEIYENKEIYVHKGKHYMPSKKQDRKIYSEFIFKNCFNLDEKVEDFFKDGNLVEIKEKLLN